MTKPYGYVRADGKGIFIYGEHQFQNTQDTELIPVYTETPQRTWVGLTDEEVDDIYQGVGKNDLMLVREVEAKLREKNT